jgi:hypothetical protein
MKHRRRRGDETDRFEADEFADELRTLGLRPTAPESRFGGHVLVGAARKTG